jgi:hypothetical protein
MTPLQEAIDNLSIEDVYLRNNSTIIVDGFEPKYNKDDGLKIAFKHLVKHAETYEIEEPEDGDSNYILRVFVELGARLSDESSEQGYAVEIEAEFVAEYNMATMLSKECVDEFALNNASFHVWPYWREFLMSQCMRLGMSKIAVPTFQVAANQNQD